MKYLILILLFVMSTAVSACDLSASGLTDAQRQQLKVACELAKSENIKSGTATSAASAIDKIDASSIEKISAISDAVVKGVTGVANGLGVAANTFIQTPAGVFLSALLVIYLVGNTVLALFIFMFLYYVIIRVAKFAINKVTFASVETVQVPRIWGLYTVTKERRVYTPVKELSSSDTGTVNAIFAFTGCALFVITAIMLIALLG